MAYLSEFRAVILSIINNIRLQFEKETPKPGLRIFLILVYLVIAVSFFSFLNYARSNLKYLKHFNALNQNLFLNNFENASRELSYLISVASSFKTKEGTKSELSISSERKKELLETIARSLEISQKQGPEEGIKILANIPHVDFVALSRSSKNPGNSYFALANIHSTFKNYITRKNKLATFEKELPKLKSEILSKKSIKLKQTQVILEELTNLFTLPENNLENINNGKYFYDSGILKDLPIINRIPDGIQNLVDFQLALNNAGGRLKMYGEDLANQFQVKISEFQTTSKVIREKINEYDQEFSNLDQEQLELSKSDKQELQTWQQQMKIFFLEVLKI